MSATVTMSTLAPLWQEVGIGTAVTARNRIVVAAHQTHFAAAEGDQLGDRYIEYLAERARGGAGLLIAEAAAVHPSTEKVGLISLFRGEIIPRLTRLAAAVH